MFAVVRRYFLFLALVLVASTAQAQDSSFPSKPIRLIVPFAVGGNADILARIVGEGLTRNMGQSVVIDNRPGGINIIGSQVVAKSAPDGYTLLLISNSHTVNPTLFGAKLPYDTEKDFTGVAKLAVTPMALVAYPGMGVNSLADLIAKAKAAPGKINYSSSGNGSSAHMAGELLNRLAGIQLSHIPYKGTAQSISDTMSGQVQLAFPSLSSAGTLIKNGQLRALGVTTARRSEIAPDIPPIGDTVPGFDAAIWTAIIAPAGVPAPIISKLNAEIVKVLKDPETKEKLIKMGVEVDTGTPKDLDDFLHADIRRWAGVFKPGDIDLKTQ